MKNRKAQMLIVALALAVCVLLFASRPNAPSISDKSPGPGFEFFVIKPRLARPLFGILPTKLEEKLEAGGELRFAHTDSGVKVGKVAGNRIELNADDWNFVIETDGNGNIAPETHLVYTMMLAEKQRKLRCRPANQANGYLRATTRAGSGELDGNFLVELATCENVETGKVIEWPPAALTVRGKFKGLSSEPR